MQCTDLTHWNTLIAVAVVYFDAMLAQRFATFHEDALHSSDCVENGLQPP